MTQASKQRAAELDAEKALLIKADNDIEDGWRRLRNQEDLLLSLRSGGHDTKQAEQLVQLLKRTLVEWERHRTLIEQRIAHLESEQ